MTHRKQNGFGRAPGDSPEPSSFEKVVEIRFAQSEQTSELVSGLLWTWGCHGSIVEDDGPDTIVTAWFDNRIQGEVVVALGAISGVTASVSKRERVDWLAHYEQSLEPLFIGERFIISPRNELVASSDRLTIVVPQEQAFGTGSHESTAMCLELLEDLEIEGTRCLDVGTGSGILAIAMVKLGASRVFAFDNDVETWGVIGRNLARNAISADRIQVFYASAEALRGTDFQVVTMNILPHIIVELVPYVVETMSSDASLIVSGILLTQRDDVISHAEASGLRLDRGREKGDWWAGLFRRT